MAAIAGTRPSIITNAITIEIMAAMAFLCICVGVGMDPSASLQALVRSPDFILIRLKFLSEV